MAKSAGAKNVPTTPAHVFAGTALKKHWERLHRGDQEPFPADPAVQEVWRLFHQGEFDRAVKAGLALGLSGYNAANKAAMIRANYVETDERKKLDQFLAVAARCEEVREAEPDNANAHYYLAYALGRYSQGISVVKALAQGLGGRIKDALEAAVKLAPRHADAHIALGTYHAEVIDKVGSMVGKLTYGASKDTSTKHFQTALKLAPDSAVAMIEYANALVMMHGKSKLEEATRLYQQAASCVAADAMEEFDVALARSELED